MNCDSLCTTADSLACASQVNPEVRFFVDKIQAGLAAIATGFNTTIEYVWPIMIKQQVVQAWSSLVLILFWFLVFFLCIKVLYPYASNKRRTYEKKGWGDDGDVGWFCLAWLPVISFGIISLVYFCSSIQCVITGFINPEYAAIKDVMRMINPTP